MKQRIAKGPLGRPWRFRRQPAAPVFAAEFYKGRRALLFGGVNYSATLSSQRSTSIAAIQPLPAAVIA